MGATPFGHKFGANLAHHRRKAGLTQEDLADLAALHRTAVGQLERGERIPRAVRFGASGGSHHSPRWGSPWSPH